VRASLQERLTHADCADPLPAQLLRKYIAYAREFCHPVLSPAASAVLKTFYLDMRRQAAAAPGLAVNVRTAFLLSAACVASDITLDLHYA
jgi:DNA replicative helicase MCM subunit Mcm2 (Cdc46/Mcm family)